MSALCFFYWKTIKRRDLCIDDLPLAKMPERLPNVLSYEKVAGLMESSAN